METRAVLCDAGSEFLSVSSFLLRASSDMSEGRAAFVCRGIEFVSSGSVRTNKQTDYQTV